MRVPGIGRPRNVIAAALAQPEGAGCTVEAMSPTIDTDPIGPSHRRYANAAALVAAPIDPPKMLDLLQRVEAAFGRKRRGARWRARPLDLDIVLWSGGLWLDERLAIPHPAFRERDFVLGPAATIASEWRDPHTGFTLRQLAGKLRRKPA